MNESSTRKSHSLTAAAALLNVSEKTLRRRIKAGKVEAEKVAIDGGGLAWRVYLGSNATDNVPEPQWTNATDVPEVVPEPQRTPFERESRAMDNAMDTQRPSVPEVSIARAGSRAGSQNGHNQGEIIELLRERLALADERERQMNLQIEAANRQAAEATAALREYLKMQAKALPSGDESSTRNNAPENAQNDAQAAKIPTPDKVPQPTKSGAQIKAAREMRPLWKIVLGIR